MGYNPASETQALQPWWRGVVVPVRVGIDVDDMSAYSESKSLAVVIINEASVLVQLIQEAIRPIATMLSRCRARAHRNPLPNMGSRGPICMCLG
jgi:hypothetical protein